MGTHYIFHDIVYFITVYKTFKVKLIRNLYDPLHLFLFVIHILSLHGI